MPHLALIGYVPTCRGQKPHRYSSEVTDEIVSVGARPLEVNSVPANIVVVPYILLASFAVIVRGAGVISAVVLAVVL